MKKKKTLILTVILCLFIISRIFVLFYTNAGTDFPYLEQSGRMGTIGFQWSRGHHQLYIEMAHKFDADHQLGLPLMGITSGILFEIFGISWQSLMFTVVLQGTFLLFLLFMFIEKHFSLEEAVMGSLIYLFAFPTWIMTTSSQPSTTLLGILTSFFVLNMTIECLSEKVNNKKIIITALSIGISIFLDFYWSLLTFLGISIYLSIYILKKDLKIQIDRDKLLTFTLVLFISLIPFIHYHCNVYNKTDTIGFSEISSKKHESKRLELIEGNYVIKSGVFLYSFFHSFGFLKHGNSLLALFMNSVFSILTIISYIGISYLSIKNILKGKFTTKSNIYTITMLLIILNISIFFFTGLWREVTRFNNIFLQRQFGYFSYLHFLSIISFVVLYFKIKRIKNILKFPIIMVIVISTLISIFTFANVTGHFVYNPIEGIYYPILSYEKAPELYKTKPQIFGYKSLTKNSTEVYGNPPIPRSIERMNSMCKEYKNRKMCHKLIGTYFGHVKRYNLKEGIELCEKIDGPKSCKDGVSWSIGYYAAYDQKAMEKYRKFPGINKNSFEEGVRTYRKLNKENVETGSLKEIKSSLKKFNTIFKGKISKNIFSYFKSTN
ncbi:MAG: hypothetical protein ABEK36_02325 [Candidatus Aenigmatarchaeota archaeon]